MSAAPVPHENPLNHPSGEPRTRVLGLFDAAAMTLLRSFDYRGRSSQAELLYWAMFCIFLVGSIISASFLFADYSRLEVLLFVPPVTVLLAAIPTMALLVRRLHDFGRSAAWALLVVGIFAVALALISLGLTGQFDNGLEAGAIIGFIAFVLGVILGLVCCVMPAHPDANRYGPRPTDEVPE